LLKSGDTIKNPTFEHADTKEVEKKVKEDVPSLLGGLTVRFARVSTVPDVAGRALLVFDLEEDSAQEVKEERHHIHKSLLTVATQPETVHWYRYSLEESVFVGSIDEGPSSVKASVMKKALELIMPEEVTLSRAVFEPSVMK
jgi:hypothetical protein